MGEPKEKFGGNSVELYPELKKAPRIFQEYLPILETAERVMRDVVFPAVQEGRRWWGNKWGDEFGEGWEPPVPFDLEHKNSFPPLAVLAKLVQETRTASLIRTYEKQGDLSLKMPEGGSNLPAKGPDTRLKEYFKTLTASPEKVFAILEKKDCRSMEELSEDDFGKYLVGADDWYTLSDIFVLEQYLRVYLLSVYPEDQSLEKVSRAIRELRKTTEDFFKKYGIATDPIHIGRQAPEEQTAQSALLRTSVEDLHDILRYKFFADQVGKFSTERIDHSDPNFGQISGFERDAVVDIFRIGLAFKGKPLLRTSYYAHDPRRWFQIRWYDR